MTGLDPAELLLGSASLDLPLDEDDEDPDRVGKASLPVELRLTDEEALDGLSRLS